MREKSRIINMLIYTASIETYDQFHAMHQDSFFEPVGTPAPNVTPLLAGVAFDPASAGPAADSSSLLDEP
jgi:hypothetical protein